MGFLASVRSSARKSKLMMDLSSLDREILHMERAFGEGLFDAITTFQSNNGGNLPSAIAFVRNEFDTYSKMISDIQDEIFLKIEAIHMNRGGVDYDPSVTDTASEAIAKLHVASFERDIRKKKRNFGVTISPVVATQIKSDSSSSETIQKIRNQQGVLKMLQRHSVDITPLYRQRDSKRRELHSIQEPVRLTQTIKRSTRNGNGSDCLVSVSKVEDVVPSAAMKSTRDGSKGGTSRAGGKYAAPREANALVAKQIPAQRGIAGSDNEKISKSAIKSARRPPTQKHEKDMVKQEFSLRRADDNGSGTKWQQKGSLNKPQQTTGKLTKTRKSVRFDPSTKINVRKVARNAGAHEQEMNVVRMEM